MERWQTLQEGQPTPTPTPTPTTAPTLQPGWHDGLYEYEGAQAHAVTRVEFGEDDNVYTYDANGNMLERVEDGVTWTQTYNSENRLSSISDGTDTWTFAYDGDNRRVGQTGPTGEVTLYVGGGAYEVRDAAGDAEVVKYYGIAGQRVALSGPDGMQYLLTDHLGSVSAVVDVAGNLLAEQRYTPFGEARFDITLGTTDFGYTGQRLLASTGLMDYNARFYVPGLGRWTQPDSIVPGAGNPQALNRFGYVFSNPINFLDPDGHNPVPKQPCIDGVHCGPNYGTSVMNANFSTVAGGLGAPFSSGGAGSSGGASGATGTGAIGGNQSVGSTSLQEDLSETGCAVVLYGQCAPSNWQVCMYGAVTCEKVDSDWYCKMYPSHYVCQGLLIQFDAARVDWLAATLSGISLLVPGLPRSGVLKDFTMANAVFVGKTADGVSLGVSLAEVAHEPTEENLVDVVANLFSLHPILGAPVDIADIVSGIHQGIYYSPNPRRP